MSKLFVNLVNLGTAQNTTQNIFKGVVFKETLKKSLIYEQI